MYDNHRRLGQSQLSICTCLVATALLAAGTTSARAQELQSSSVIRKISGLSDKLELTTNTSRILTLDKNIPRVQVNNPELLAVTPLSATQVQISAKKAGVTQVNLWDDEGKIHTVDILIYGDARELEVALQTQFPHSSIKVFRYSESLVLTGFTDRPDHVPAIMQLAADYSPKVINNVQVGGVQQILLKVKVMEISRTKLRQLGVDWAWFGGGNGSFAVSRPGGLIGTFSSTAKTITTAGDTVDFGIIGNNSGFFGVLDALQDKQVAKILADPNIVAVSGRPAQFNVGGEVPIIVPQSLGTSSIEYKPFGTQVDFLPIVLGNGNIRLEVRPRISFLDPTNGIQVNGIAVPGFNVRQVDTAVEMKAGQTFALAGLVQERTETRNHGLPYLSDVPVVGVPFRRTRDETNEIELLIIITPEFVDPMDPCEVPCGGPGYNTVTPTSKQLYCAGHVEVPTACNPTNGLQACGQDPCGHCNAGCNTGCNCNGGAAMNGGAVVNGGMPVQNMMPSTGAQVSGGTGYDDSANGTTLLPAPDASGDSAAASPAPQDLSLPSSVITDKGEKPATETKPALQSTTPPLPPQPSPAAPAAPKPTATNPATSPNGVQKPTVQPSAPALSPAPASGSYTPAPESDDLWMPPSGSSAQSSPGAMPHYTPQRQPVFMRNAYRPNNPQSQQPAASRESSLIGPVGYDVQQ
jgi:pilus assembly protein CpaC